MKKSIVIIIGGILLFIITLHVKANIRIGIKPNSTFLIEDEINLNGGIMTIPSNVTLHFKGGKIKNGELIGCKTKIKGNYNEIFEDVVISGSWNVPEISTDMFLNLNYDNAIKNVFALSDSLVKNNIYIGRGVYKVSVKKGFSCITVHDDTNIVLDGDIVLIPNALPVYNILFLKGENISLT